MGLRAQAFTQHLRFSHIPGAMRILDPNIFPSINSILNTINIGLSKKNPLKHYHKSKTSIINRH